MKNHVFFLFCFFFQIDALEEYKVLTDGSARDMGENQQLCQMGKEMEKVPLLGLCKILWPCQAIFQCSLRL